MTVHSGTKRPRLPATIWALGFVSLLMDLSSEMIHSLLPVYLTTVLGASAFAVGLIEGAGEATALIVKVFSGAASDWSGRRKPLAIAGYALGALSKPLFALATGTGMVFAARLIDRVGKGIRGAPRDALVADLTPREIRGAAFGLRQSLDTVGAFLGPLTAVGLMLLWSDDFRAVFWIAVLPAALSVALLVAGVKEPEREARSVRFNPLRPEYRRQLSPDYWWVVTIGAVFTLARFSEAFLVLRAHQSGLAIAYVPFVLIVMNIVYALGAYPFGRIADRMSHRTLLAVGLLLLICANVSLAQTGAAYWLWIGIGLWGAHMAATQGLLATMVAHVAPANLRGTAFGFFNLVSGGAMLVSSTIAGVVWDRLGAAASFWSGAGISAMALALLLLRARA